MKKTVTIDLHKMNGLKLNIEKREIQIDTTFKAYNLEAHQCLNQQNIETVIDCVKDGNKEETIRFLRQLQEQAEILSYALHEIEGKVNPCQGLELKL